MVTPNGAYLYSANYGSGSVSAYSIDPSTGALTPVAGSPFAAQSHPRGAALDPTGSFLYVTNEGSNSITEYAISPSTGALTLIGVQAGLASPFGLSFD